MRTRLRISCVISKNRNSPPVPVPSDQDIVIEIVRDELGDRRVCVLTPFGNRVHAPWCMAVECKDSRRERLGGRESLWSDDGFVIRLPG